MKLFRMRGLATLAVLVATSLSAGMSAPSADADTALTNPGASPQLVGGTPATMHPGWIASVHLDYPPGSGQSITQCTGELVAPQWVATASHCVTGANGLGIDPADNHLWVQVGSNSRIQGAAGSQDFTVTQVVPYPEWLWGQLDSKGRSGDIALLKLNGYATEQPAYISSTDPKTGATVRELGWGRTDPSNTGPEPVQLQQVDTTYAGAGAAATPCNTNPDNPITVDENCANSADGWRGPCGGDSGGPLLAQVHGRWALIGVLSQSPGEDPLGCGDEADMYADVPYYEGWLAAVGRGVDPQIAENYLPGGQATPTAHTAPTSSQAVDTMRHDGLDG